MAFSLKSVLIILSFLSSTALLANSSSTSSDDFDRLDGTGRSGETAQVIEWNNNLEIHVYPVGSLSSLGLKLDKKNKDKPVMVIEYHFQNGTSLVRRAILGISLNEGFRVYRDPAEKEFDKVIISNESQRGLSAMNYSEPHQLYPDGHPVLSSQEADKNKNQDTSYNEGSLWPSK